MTKLSTKLSHLPSNPGVYFFKDDQGEVLYVGKAKNLKKRVRSYFLKSRGLEPRLEIMKQQIADLDFTVVSSETESLMLENNLIKQYQPRFNVLLRDDKNYQFIKLDYDQEIPQIYTVRRVDKKDLRGSTAKYFGPYSSGLSVKETLRFIKNVFRLCRSKKVGSKPCFAYHLGRCDGVCIGKISLATYREVFQDIEQLLGRRQGALLKSLQTTMRQAARKRRFEKAARVRDQVRALDHLWQRQKIVSAKKDDQDYLGLAMKPQTAVICLFIVRGGKLIDTEYFELAHEYSSVEEIFSRFLLRYYDETSDLPREIMLPVVLPSRVSLEQTLEQIAGKKLKLVVPRRGKKHGLLNLAEKNARLYEERQVPEFQKGDPQHAADQLAKALGLPTVLERIEGYDISNIQGTNPVGSMVVFTAGRPDKSQYRKFKINVKETPDDFAMMAEMLTRRLSRSREATREKAAVEEVWRLPELMVIDGGKGQLNVAVKALKNANLSIPVIGLAKRLEEVFVPGQKQPLILPPASPALFLLQRIRDEAHRFAITFYRLRHRRAQTYSRLEDIAGVGPTTRKKLIKKFGSFSGVIAASSSELTHVVGKSLARKIKEQLS